MRSYMQRNVATRPWRKIVKFMRYTWSDGVFGLQYRSVRVVVTFDCGHTQHYKGSQAPKGKQARCRRCPSEKSLTEQP